MPFIIMLFGSLILYAFIRAAVRAPGQALGKKFQSLGQMEGKSLDEICAVVGQPTSMSAVGNGKTLYQWMESGFHIAILFDTNKTFAGITSVYGGIVS